MNTISKKLSILVAGFGLLSIGFVIGCSNQTKDTNTTSQQEQTAPAMDTKTSDSMTSDQMENSTADSEAAEMNGTETAEPTAYRNEEGQLICPVMGTVIASEEKAVGYQDYEGMRYYFCCAGCPDLFAKDPEKYIKKD